MNKVGELFYDLNEKRYTIRYDIETFSTTFHCGDCLEVWYNGRWIDTRFEINNLGWYLVGVDNNQEITSLKARLHV